MKRAKVTIVTKNGMEMYRVTWTVGTTEVTKDFWSREKAERYAQELTDAQFN